MDDPVVNAIPLPCRRIHQQELLAIVRELPAVDEPVGAVDRQIGQDDVLRGGFALDEDPLAER